MSGAAHPGQTRQLPRAALFLLALCQFLCPLLFFTDLTRNPYFTQIALLNVFLTGTLLLWALPGLSGRASPISSSAADLPFALWLLVCVLSLVKAWFSNGEFFHPSIFSEGLRNLVFLLVNCGAAYFIGRLLRLDEAV